MTGVRGLTGLVGVGLVAFGVRELLGMESADLLDAIVWLAAGVVAHDGLLAPIVIGVGLATTRLLPRWSQAPVVAGLVVLGSVTAVSVPVLGRFGERADNPTLLDRDYLAGWLLVLIVVSVVVAVASLVSRKRAMEAQGGAGPGG